MKQIFALVRLGLPPPLRPVGVLRDQPAITQFSVVPKCEVPLEMGERYDPRRGDEREAKGSQQEGRHLALPHGNESCNSHEYERERKHGRFGKIAEGERCTKGAIRSRSSAASEDAHQQTGREEDKEHYEDVRR